MFALSDAREFSFSQVPYLERDQKISLKVGRDVYVKIDVTIAT